MPATVLAEHLAFTVLVQCQRDLETRGVGPEHIDVRFRAADAGLGDHWSNIALSGNDARVPLLGNVDDMAAVFSSIPSSRLVILGAPGAGKSVAAAQLVRDLLERRRLSDPVPVILQAGSWDPSRVSLQQWIAEQVPVHYPGWTAKSQSGSAEVRRLVNEGLVFPVLDGLDEMPESLRAAGMQSLNRMSGGFIVLCRSSEYDRLVETTGVLGRAAVVEIDPLSPSAVADYLARVSATRPRIQATSFVDLLAKPGADPLSSVLSSPLMLWLFRRSYIGMGNDPCELMDRRRFPDRTAIEEHLLQMLLPSLLTRSNSPEYVNAHAVGQWLTFLAGSMAFRGDHGFVWWELDRLVPRSVLAGAGALVVGGGVVQFVAGFLSLFDGIVAGVAFGLFAYLTGWLINGRRPAVEGVKGPVRLSRSLVIRGTVIGVVGAAPLALVASQTGGWRSGVAVGVVLCVLLCVNVWFSSGPVRPAANPVDAFRASRMFALVRWSAIGLTVSLTLGFLAGSVPVTARYSALAGSLGLVVTLLWLVVGSAWGRFCVVRAWFAVRGVLPWRLFDFLESMRRTGLIRVDGQIYQFRHARLQDLFARSARAVRENG
jgi:hypothetical protein